MTKRFEEDPEDTIRVPAQMELKRKPVPEKGSSQSIEWEASPDRYVSTSQLQQSRAYRDIRADQ